MEFTHLLAKSCPDPENPPLEATLVGHSFEVTKAVEVLLAELSDALTALLSQERLIIFKKLIVVSAVLHDLGKANNVFQGMLAGDKLMNKRLHPVTHEILSALLVAKLEPSLFEWLQKIFGTQHDQYRWMISWIVGGHHLRLHRDRPFPQKENERLVRVQGIPSKFVFWGDHPDIQRIFQRCKSQLTLIGVVERPNLYQRDVSLEEDDAGYIEDIVDEYIEESDKYSTTLSEEEKKFLALAKALLIAADVAGSALTCGIQDSKEWIRSALGQTLSEHKASKIVASSLEGKAIRLFQVRIRDSTTPVTLTIAGCGNGKTTAAYAWATKRAKGRKLYFCYPTTGTASSGFEDYLLVQNTIERALIHGRANVDLEKMLETSEKATWKENQKLESLKAWSQQVISCTTDTVLGLIQNQRRGLFSFPAMMKAAFVFDEIHSYDSKLFGALLNFLTLFPHIPFLLMSASIPPARLVLLRDALGDRLSEPILGAPELEELKRYLINWRKERKDCWDQVIEQLRSAGKVLWVCNRVDDAVEIYEQACRKGIKPEPLLYHSRYRYMDRVDIQEKVISRFRGMGPVLVIATQVCEMSLDISADLLVSALAPFPSIIQRLGRLNRYATKQSKPCECLIHDFSCSEGRPYFAHELETSRKILSGLFDGQPCSQRDLAIGIEQLQENEVIKNYSAWIDGVWESDQRPLREMAPSLTLLLKKDIPSIKKYLADRGLKPNIGNVAGWTIPMWFNSHIQIDKHYGGYPVISSDDIEYHPQKGARWKKRQQWETI